MIDKEIRRKIETNEEVSAEELIKYFKHLPAPIEKGLFKKLRQRRAEKTHEETQQYLLENFDTVMSSSSTIQMIDFLNYLPWLCHREELFEKLSHNTSKLVELFNSKYGDEVAQSLQSALTNSREAHVFFEKGFADLYTNTNQHQFNIRDFLVSKPLSKGIKPLILNGMLDVINSGKIRQEDIPFFLSEYLHHEALGSRGVWDLTLTTISSVSEETKEKIQKNISPEAALYLVQSTDKPLSVRQLLRNFGLETPEIISYLDTHLDEIVDEISEHSHSAPVVKDKIQELLEEGALNPSEIEYASKGGFGRVFKIGDKVLKFGRTPHTEKLPRNSELFLQPYLRQSLNGCDFIEVYDQVDLHVGREDMYQLFKALRDQGLVWTDVKHSNVGRLLKPNSPHFKETGSDDFSTVGFVEDTDIPISQPGNIVLLDLDFIFPENAPYDVPEEHTAKYTFYEFDSRYKSEKAAEQNQSQTKKKTHDLDEI